jgi:hypothetical protein
MPSTYHLLSPSIDMPLHSFSSLISVRSGFRITSSRFVHSVAAPFFIPEDAQCIRILCTYMRILSAHSEPPFFILNHFLCWGSSVGFIIDDSPKHLYHMLFLSTSQYSTNSTKMGWLLHSFRFTYTWFTWIFERRTQYEDGCLSKVCQPRSDKT